jgi:hypothetical protein
MRQVSNEQLERRYIRLWQSQKTKRYPSWWIRMAPHRGSKFWAAVEAMRKDAGVTTWDTSGMTYIIKKLDGGHREY